MIPISQGASNPYLRNDHAYIPTNGAAPSSLADRSPLFAGLQPDDYSKAVAAARVKEFARGEMMAIEGDAIKQVLMLTSGLVKTTQVGMTGAEVILRLYGPGDVLGAVSLFSTGKHTRTSQAFRLCRALAWDASTFRALVDRFPVLHKNMARILGEHLAELEQRFHEVATEQVGPRVARQLLRLQEKFGRSPNGEVVMGLSREELAQMTGTTLFTVSRLLSAWEARGWVKCRREGVTICNPQSLGEVSSDS